MSILLKKYYIFAFIIIFTGVFFRLYNLSWGSPFFFHPDERNIASGVSQLLFPDKLNPHFFAYGSLPIYATYFGSVFINLFDNLFSDLRISVWTVSFENAILMGRVISSFLSILTLFLIYKAGKNFYGRRVGIIAVLLASLSVGLIQYAHFSTFESWLTFLTSALFYLCIKYLDKREFKDLLLVSITLGALVSVKISSLVFLFLVIGLVLITEIRQTRKLDKRIFMQLENVLLKLLITIGVTILTVVATSPFFWIDNSSFLSSISYESSVALGTLKVFYTQGFENTIPILYQSIKVYPFLMNPVVWIVALTASVLLTIRAVGSRDMKLIILLLFLFISFTSQAFLFVKWIRYYVPTLPFLYLILGIFFSKGLSSRKLNHKIVFTSVFLLLFVSYVFAFSYFKTVLYGNDTRIDAARWAAGSIDRSSKIVSEIYDMGIVPFNAFFNDITLHNFYDLEKDVAVQRDLAKRLDQSNYVIIPSQRILETRLSNPHLYPRGNLFYSSLVSERGYKKLYETECDIFCNILYLGSPQFSFEQTANVFDRPTVTIYQHVK